MPYAPECQPLAVQLSALIVQEQAQLAAIDPLTGSARWQAIQNLGTLRQQIADQQSLLDACQKQHGLDLSAEVVVFDLTGDAGTNRIGRLWQLTANGQAVKLTNSIQPDNTITFPDILGTNRQSFGITIEEVDNLAVNGPDFRSGPLPASAGAAVNEIDPVGRIEIVILSPMTISSDTLKQSLPPLPLQQSIPVQVMGNVGISITALDFEIDNGTVSLTASGTASALTATSPFTFSAAVHIAPVFTMTPSNIFDVSMVGAPTLTMTGFAGSIVQELAPLVSSSLSGQIVQQLNSVLSTFVGARVAQSLGSSAIPAGSVLSVRELTIDGANVSLTPVLGAFGTILSTFKPAPLPAASSLASVVLSVATIGTEATPTPVDGHVNLTAGAPAGGATIHLSTTRSDLMLFDSDTLTIPEGQLSGEFIITAVTPPIAQTTPVDCTIYASLGDQRLQTTLTILPQTPAGAAAPAQPSSPTTAVTNGVASLQVSPNPIMPFSHVTGTVTLNGFSVTSTLVTISFDTSLPPMALVIPPAVKTQSFTFTIMAPPPSGTLGITASTDSGNSVTINVPVQPFVFNA